MNSPANSGWTWVGSNCGVASATYIPIKAVDGTQAAFIQGPGTVSQVLSGFTIGASYLFSFWTILRSYVFPGIAVTVSIDATPILTVTPVSYTAWAQSTATFIATATSHTLSFTTIASATYMSSFDCVIIEGLAPAVSIVRDRANSGVVGYLRGICLGGPTSMYSDTTFGRHLQTGVRKETVDGNPTSPCLALDYPGFWRFRWGLSPGVHGISVNAKQVSNVIGKRPSIVVKANSDIGINADVTGSAGSNTGWTTIGPLVVTASGFAPVWVELHNNDTDTFFSPAYFDHIVTT